MTDSFGFHWLQRVGAGACRMGLQPLVAEIVAGRVLHGELHVDDAADVRRQRIVEERRRVGPIGDDLDRLVIDLSDRLFDVVLGQAELGDDEGGRLVEGDDTPERPDHRVGRHRIAGSELAARVELEGEGLAVLGNVPALGEARPQLQRLRVELDELVVEIVDHVATRELEALGRIEHLQIVDRVGDHQRVGRRFCLRGEAEAETGGHQNRCRGKPAQPALGPDTGAGTGAGIGRSGGFGHGGGLGRQRLDHGAPSV